MLLSDFDYFLPDELIAQTPLVDRSASRLLLLNRENGVVEHLTFQDCLDLVHPNDVLVMNNTRVNAWRFVGKKPTGGEIEFLCLNKIEPGVFETMVKPAKRLKPGIEVKIGDDLFATMIDDREGAIKLVKLTSNGDLEASMQKHGSTPLPPYITEVLADPERYQTVVATENGSAAAPTAGLHFTPEILSKLKEKGVKIAEVTLHVGIDTFRPIQTDDVSEHQMHGEECEILPEAANMINEATGRIIAVGTTSVRTLESFATGTKKVEHGRKSTRIFVHPGFNFQIVDGMFTNFHMPKTTMLLMISALSKREYILAAYAEAVKEGYRFLSFGDSMLIL
jgi:S-adenosylmethionine:tRNA ribosyltransferase-isomerase